MLFQCLTLFLLHGISDNRRLSHVGKSLSKQIQYLDSKPSSSVAPPPNALTPIEHKLIFFIHILQMDFYHHLTYEHKNMHRLMFFCKTKCHRIHGLKSAMQGKKHLQIGTYISSLVNPIAGFPSVSIHLICGITSRGSPRQLKPQPQSF